MVITVNLSQRKNMMLNKKKLKKLLIQLSLNYINKEVLLVLEEQEDSLVLEASLEEQDSLVLMLVERANLLLKKLIKVLRLKYL